MKITHWVPTGSAFVSWPCVLSWMNLVLPDGATRSFYKGAVSSPDVSWNKAVSDFLDTDNDWLFSTHDDVVFEPDTLKQLLSWNYPLVSALIFMRQAPVVPHIWKAYEKGEQYAHRIEDTRKWFLKHTDYIRLGSFIMTPTPPDALVEVDFTSTSCTLIHRTVLEAMRAKCGSKWFLMDDAIAGGGEDRRFFEIAAKVGYQAYVDRSCVVGHLMNNIPTSSADFFAWDNVSVFHNTGERIEKENIVMNFEKESK